MLAFWLVIERVVGGPNIGHRLGGWLFAANVPLISFWSECCVPALAGADQCFLKTLVWRRTSEQRYLGRRCVKPCAAVHGFRKNTSFSQRNGARWWLGQARCGWCCHSRGLCQSNRWFGAASVAASRCGDKANAQGEQCGDFRHRFPLEFIALTYPKARHRIVPCLGVLVKVYGGQKLRRSCLWTVYGILRFTRNFFPRSFADTYFEYGYKIGYG